MSDPYRTPGRPPGRLLHGAVKVFFTKSEWDELQTAAQEDGAPCDEWILALVTKALRDRHG